MKLRLCWIKKSAFAQVQGELTLVVILERKGQRKKMMNDRRRSETKGKVRIEVPMTKLDPAPMHANIIPNLLQYLLVSPHS